MNFFAAFLAIVLILVAPQSARAFSSKQSFFRRNMGDGRMARFVSYGHSTGKIDQLTKEMLQAEQVGDILKAVNLRMEVIELRKQDPLLHVEDQLREAIRKNDFETSQALYQVYQELEKQAVKVDIEIDLTDEMAFGYDHSFLDDGESQQGDDDDYDEI
mmetsp:Transcript_42352/g.70072  ORF Transcript_42352/g.70072 Transcript_42352/m.70072 type:complete len:159 (-) Transcript_42352:370-846(-)